MKFLQKKDAILNKFRRQKYYAAQRRNFHIYTCPQCKQKIRIPKGKGKISITCPKCRTSFIKKELTILQVVVVIFFEKPDVFGPEKDGIINLLYDFLYTAGFYFDRSDR